MPKIDPSWICVLALAVALPALAACATKAPPGSPAYQEGWKYGCWDGHDTAADPEWTAELSMPPRHGADPDFARGQADGYTWCQDHAISRPTGGG
jgi:hypothetical protein